MHWEDEKPMMQTRYSVLPFLPPAVRAHEEQTLGAGDGGYGDVGGIAGGLLRAGNACCWRLHHGNGRRQHHSAGAADLGTAGLVTL